MNADQAKYLRSVIFSKDENNKTLAAFSKVILDNEHIFRPDLSPVIWDDDKSIVHCIRANNDFPTQSYAPIEIESGAYDVIHYIVGGYDLTNFEKALEKLGIDGERKEVCMKFAKGIVNQAKEERSPTPYYTTTAKPIPNAKKNLDRDDGITTITPTTSVETNPDLS
jgi:hypothetical protein